MHLLFVSLVEQNVNMAASFGFPICKLWEWLSTLQLCFSVCCIHYVCVCVCVCMFVCLSLPIHVSLFALFCLILSIQRLVNILK